MPKGWGFMFKHILVPLDGSEESERITGWVAGLANALDAKVTLLAVVNPADMSLPERIKQPRQGATGDAPHDAPGGEGREPVTGVGFMGAVTPGMGRGGAQPDDPPGAGTQEIDRAVEMAKTYLQGQVRQVEAKGADVESKVVLGSPAEEIVQQAGEVGADLIAMATHRESALARGILGSVTDRVLHSSRVPVMAVHPSDKGSRSNDGPPTTVVIPLDGSELSETAVPVGMAVAKACKAEVVFLRAVRFPYYGMTGPGVEYYGDYGIEEQRQVAEEYLTPFLEQATAEGLKAHARATVGTPAARIIEETDGIPNALVVMSTNGASGIKRFVLGSVTDKVVRSSGNPVIVLPPPEED